MKKVVIIQLNIHSDKEKQKALKAVSSIQGVDAISMDMEAKKMTITGDVDPVEVICNLKRSWSPEIISVAPKEEPKKDGGKEDAKKKEEAKKREEEEKNKHECNCAAPQPFPCQCYRPCYQPMNYVCVEECPPPSCVIT